MRESRDIRDLKNIRLDFEQAKAKHLLFKSKLRSILYGIAVDEEEVVLAHECPLGIWINEFALKEYSHLTEMQELEKVHASIHATAGRLVQLYHQGKIDEARHGLAEVEAIAEKLLALLNTIAEKIIGEVNPASYPHTQDTMEPDALSELQQTNEKLDRQIRLQAQELQELKERFGLLAKATHDVVWDWNLLTNEVWWNDGFQSIFGYEQNDIDHTTSTWFHRLHPEDKEQVLEKIHEAIGSGEKNWADQYRFLKKDGSYAYIYDRGYILHDEEGKPYRMLGSMMNITDSRNADLALKKSETKFRHMVQQAPVAIGILTGKEMIIDSANDQLLNLWGKTKEVIGKTLLEGLPEITDQPFPRQLAEVYKTGIPYYGYETLAKLMRNGQLQDAYFNFVYAPVREADDSISGVMVVASEVTSAILAKKEAEQSEKRFSNLILEAPMATAVYLGEDMIIGLANEKMISLWGKDQSVIGKKLDLALPELEGQPFMELLWKVYYTGVAFEADDMRADLVVDGQLKSFYFNFTYKPLRDAEGKIYGILNMALDITYKKAIELELENKVQQRTEELQSANEHLQRSNEELKEFAYVASHDLQEPLRKIQMFADRLQTNSAQKLDGKENTWLDRIMVSSRRMSVLIKDLLDYSRLSQNKTIYASTDLNAVYSNILEDLDLVIHQSNAVIHADPLPVMEAVDIQMNQLFYNLIVNSLKFKKKDAIPEISITCQPATEDLLNEHHLPLNQPYFLLRFTDNGIGFDQELAENIFVIFHRLHTREAYEGTGIGLALCKKVVDNHHGVIYAEGREGKGARFNIIIPYKQKH